MSPAEAVSVRSETIVRQPAITVGEIGVVRARGVPELERELGEARLRIAELERELEELRTR